MALGDGIRRNIAYVDPAERALFRDALIQLNHRFFPGDRADSVPGHVSLWFKQDEIHQATHVHNGPEFLPWHREIVNRLEEMLRQINPQLSLHYWDWTQDPRNIPDGNLGGGITGALNLFTSDFMGYGGLASAEIGEPWLSAGYYVPGAVQHRDSTGNPADPPRLVSRSVGGGIIVAPANPMDDNNVVNAPNYPTMRGLLENIHNAMHGFVNMGGAHISFRDPFVFLLHSNVDRLFSRWQTDPAHTERLDSNIVYGSESGDAGLNGNVEPWSTGHSFDEFGSEHFTRPWYAPENEGIPKNYKHPSIIAPPCYDTNFTNVPIVEVRNPGTPPIVNFNDVPEGDTAIRAAIFRVYGCGNATIRIQAGGAPASPFFILHPLTGELTVHHAAQPYIEGRIWIAYTAGAAEVPVPDGSVTFECVESGQTFTFTLRANSIIRPRVAVMLALDQSSSMDWAAGTSGAIRVEVLRDAAKTFMEIIPPGNGAGVIRFDHDAYPVGDATWPGLAVRRINTVSRFDPDRVAAINSVTSHVTNLAGATSVGDGVVMARNVLNALPAADYQHKAIIVFTDGQENRAAFLADVSGDIDNRTFAIGLGNETQVDTAKLNLLTNGTGGYLLLTGVLSASIDDYFRTSKYFLQILAGVTNNNIILDPNGYIAPGTVVRIPFQLNEADITCNPILLTDFPVVGMAIETPGGDIIDAGNAAGLGVDYAEGDNSRHYRYTLPVAFPGGNHTGTWYVVLKVEEDKYKRYLEKLSDNHSSYRSYRTHGAKYSVVINTYSNLKMAARIDQNSMAPGATITLHSVLTEYQIPVDHRASVQVEMTRPDNTQTVINLNEVEAGVFENSFQANMAGTYVCRFLAKGATLRGTPFTREQTLTAAVFNGGDTPGTPGRPQDGDGSSGGSLAELFQKCCRMQLWFWIFAIILLALILWALLRR